MSDWRGPGARDDSSIMVTVNTEDAASRENRLRCCRHPGNPDRVAPIFRQIEG